MDTRTRQAIKQALKRFPVAAEGEDEPVGELQVAEYIIYLLALDTYIRYVEEATKTEDPIDDVIAKGIRLLRGADGELDQIQGFLDQHLPNATHKKMLIKYLRVRATDPAGVGRRSLGLRTLLSRGGATTMRAVFQTNRALREIKGAIAASMLDDADAALDIFASIPMQNTRLKAWVDYAAKSAGSGVVLESPIQAGVKESTGAAPAMMTQQVEELAATGADGTKAAQEAQTDKITEIEQAATAAARRNLESKGELDGPMTKSEVIGVAVAAATAVATDPSNSTNVPEPLKGLDDEQRAAALTDGRVLVAAGAGSGKSTTAVARIAYLIKERGVYPGRILATTFNSKAASELKERIGKSIGGDILNQMSVGTMHSLFRRFISEYGTSEEKNALGKGFIEGGSGVARTVQRLWEECFDTDDRPTPKLKDMLQLKTQWAGNNISPAQAKAEAQDTKSADGADWFELYEGLKGAIPGWEPPCEGKARELSDAEHREKMQAWRRRGGHGAAPQRRGTTFETFIAKSRPDGTRLADFDDMLGILLTILEREPAVKKAIQKMYDHVIVDEAQDLNQVQTSILNAMTEHIGDGSDGKSYWVIGDDKQSIYAFRGAKPELFIDLDGKEGWKTRSIRTNYRCEPEFVEAANKLISHNENQLQIAAVPNPHRTRGSGSLKVETAGSEAEAALSVIERIKHDSMVLSENERPDYYGTNAVLTRTNKELHAYETACIIRGIPYARKGTSSFMGSPETLTLLGYTQLVTGDDNLKLQKALAQVINKPNRFFVSPKVGQEAVEQAIRDYARDRGLRINEVNPTTALRDRQFQRYLVAGLTKTSSGFKFEKGLETIDELADAIGEMQANLTAEGFKTEDLFDSILGLSGTASAVDPATGRTNFVRQTLRQSLQVELRDTTKDDDEEEDDALGGNIAFLYELAKVDPTDSGDLEKDPGTPLGFKAKMERYAERMRDLRVDLDKWDKQQAGLPSEQRSAPPACYLGTAHSTKGAQWNSVFVSMPKGKFPFEPPQRPGQPPTPPDPAQLEGERRLAYVALTRASKTLTILCPDEVGGKAAGVSPFIGEAGLTLGENVPKPGSQQAAMAEAEELTKTAALDDAAAFLGPEPDEFDTVQAPTWPLGGVP